MKRKQEKQSAEIVDIFYCSGMSAILRKSFAACLPAKAGLDLLWILSRCISRFVSSGTSRFIGDKRKYKK